jgi:flavin reductase (DIM6/NTAB) family NADH-FMN oxidoreductase RutF
MPVDPEALRAVMRHWTTGVTVLTTRDGAQVHGMTVNAFTSVSLEPPLVLACIERVVRTHALVDSSRVFAISFLREGQEHISNRFAGRQTDVSDRFEGLSTFTAITGSPILADNLGYLDCVVTTAYEAGSHTIFLAEVVDAKVQNSQKPLVYFDRNYHILAS